VFRFVIRDVLWLMVVVAIGSAWWVDHRQLMERVARLKIDAQMRRAVDGVLIDF
jgi:hypothetical protein